LLEELALPPLGLEQHNLAIRECVRERDPGRAPTRPNVDDRPFEAGDERGAAQRIVEQYAARGVLVADRRQSRRRDDRGQPCA
jgi:hypothetical protein